MKRVESLITSESLIQSTWYEIHLLSTAYPLTNHNTINNAPESPAHQCLIQENSNKAFTSQILCLIFDLVYELLISFSSINRPQPFYRAGLSSGIMSSVSAIPMMAATPSLNTVDLRLSYTAANKRLFILDYDGTLTPIVNNPADARPTQLLLKIIENLSQNPKNVVWIVSGRDQRFLEEHFGQITSLGLSAEHGCFMRLPGSKFWDELAKSLDMDWQEDVMKLFHAYEKQLPGSQIERKNVTVTFHYRNADPELVKIFTPMLHYALTHTITNKYDVHVTEGKMNHEVRPNSINKGTATAKLIEHHSPDFVFCAGDDTTDEDMFKALAAANIANESTFAVVVGPPEKESVASWKVPEAEDVVEALGLLTVWE